MGVDFFKKGIGIFEMGRNQVFEFCKFLVKILKLTGEVLNVLKGLLYLCGGFRADQTQLYQIEMVLISTWVDQKYILEYFFFQIQLNC